MMLAGDMTHSFIRDLSNIQIVPIHPQCLKEVLDKEPIVFENQPDQPLPCKGNC